MVAFITAGLCLLTPDGVAAWVHWSDSAGALLGIALVIYEFRTKARTRTVEVSHVHS